MKLYSLFIGFSMRIFFLLILICFLYLKRALPQTRYGKTLSKNVIQCVNSKNNHLYAGIDNPIIINYKPINTIDTFFIETNNGILFRDSLDLITIPSRGGKSRFLFYDVINNDTTLAGYKYMSVENIPEPSLKIDSVIIRGEGIVSKNLLHKCDSLQIYFTSDIEDSKNWYRVYQFSVGYSYGGYYVSFLNKSNMFLKGTLSLIDRIEPGKEISIKVFVESQGYIRKELPIYRIKVY